MEVLFFKKKKINLFATTTTSWWLLLTGVKQAKKLPREKNNNKELRKVQLLVTLIKVIRAIKTWRIYLVKSALRKAAAFQYGNRQVEESPSGNVCTCRGAETVECSSCCWEAPGQEPAAVPVSILCVGPGCRYVVRCVDCLGGRAASWETCFITCSTVLGSVGCLSVVA